MNFYRDSLLFPALSRPWWTRAVPLLLVEQGEERSPRDVLGDNGKLAGVVQAGSHELDDTGVVQAAEDGNLPAEHVHVRLGAVGVGSVPGNHGKAKVSQNVGLANTSNQVTDKQGKTN